VIDATFTKSIVDLAKVMTFEVKDANGKVHTYSTKQLHQVEPTPAPLMPKVSVHTLEGLADLINEVGLDSLAKPDYYLHIVDHENVGLFAVESDDEGRRQELIHASPVPFDKFPFGKWMAQEMFVIGVASQFSSTPDKEYVLKLASTLTDEEVATSEDNGFSQKATVKAGVKVAENVIVKPTVELAPFRTFPEIGQPISQFVFRCRKGQMGPELMLIEADGGKWKIDAIREIEKRLKEIVSEVDLVA
jgi:hypothetical protein